MLNDKEMEFALRHSFRDFHVKGLHYVSLPMARGPGFKKVYFFENDAATDGPLVMPHDHRYNFGTKVLAGQLENVLYKPVSKRGMRFNRFSYRTPLNGGDGFTWESEVLLGVQSRNLYKAGEKYGSMHSQIHTLANIKAGTILVLAQYPDVLPLDVPTTAYAVEREPPSLSGLYSKMDGNEIVQRVTVANNLLKGIR